MLRSVSSREGLRLDRILLRCGSAEAALRAPPRIWREECGFVPDPERTGEVSRARAETAAHRLEELGGRVLDVTAAGYPASLLHLPQPPPILFIRGSLGSLSRPGIAVVGTRSASEYGRDAAATLTLGLVRAGYTIVSGLARGIDSVAHRTALELGGDSVAVLGTGLDVVYPPENRPLIEGLARRGCVITEFPPGSPPRKYHFPQRNRIIAGLARAVLVVEAGPKSGALITAEYALEGGREVFAVPGPIHSPGSEGTHRLIREGAALATCAADVLETLRARTGEPLPSAPSPSSSAAEERAPRLAANASRLARTIWTELKKGPADIEGLAAAVDSEANHLYSALLELELSGLIEKTPGPRYRRVRFGAN